MRTIVNGTRIWFDVEGAGLAPDGTVMRAADARPAAWRTGLRSFLFQARTFGAD